MTDAGPAAVPAPRPRDHRDPRLCIASQAVVTPPPAGQPGHGSGAVLRNQPVRIVEGCVEGGYTGVYELICPDCGDHPEEPRLRGRGLATQLIAAAEAEAAARGCSQTVHFTYAFQAQALYERNGYELVGRVEGFPSGTDVLWYLKRLKGGADRR